MNSLTKIFLAVICILFTAHAFAQNDDSKSSDKKKKKKSLALYTGLNFDDLKVSEPDYSSGTGTGYHFGANYRIGNLIYTQPGLRFCESVYKLTTNSPLPDPTSDKIKVSRIGIPVTAGVNVIPVADRLINLRFFLGLEPAFVTGVSENKFGYTKSDVNSTLVYGMIGAGLDLGFFMFEGGYTNGWGDVLKNNIESKPHTFYFNVGLRL